MLPVPGIWRKADAVRCETAQGNFLTAAVSICRLPLVGPFLRHLNRVTFGIPLQHLAFLGSTRRSQPVSSGAVRLGRLASHVTQQMDRLGGIFEPFSRDWPDPSKSLVTDSLISRGSTQDLAVVEIEKEGSAVACLTPVSKKTAPAALPNEFMRVMLHVASISGLSTSGASTW